MRYTSNQQVRQPGPKGETSPQKPTRAAQVHGDRNPPDRVSVQRQKASGENRATIKKPGSGQHGQTVGIATIVGSGTHSALFHGGVSGHAAGVPTALCRSSNGPGHGKLGHEICKQNSPGRSSDSLNPTAPSRCQPPTANHQPPINRPPPTATIKKEHRPMGIRSPP